MPVLVIVQPAPLEADWTWMRLGEPGEGPFAMTFLHRWRASPQVSSLVLDGEVGPVWTKSSAPRWGPAASTLTDLGSQREDPYSHGTSLDKLGRWDSVWGSGCAIRYARTGAGQGDGEAASQPGRAGTNCRCTFLKKSQAQLPPGLRTRSWGQPQRAGRRDSGTRHTWRWKQPDVHRRPTAEGKVASRSAERHVAVRGMG